MSSASLGANMSGSTQPSSSTAEPPTADTIMVFSWQRLIHGERVIYGYTHNIHSLRGYACEVNVILNAHQPSTCGCFRCRASESVTYFCLHDSSLHGSFPATFMETNLHSHHPLMISLARALNRDQRNGIIAFFDPRFKVSCGYLDDAPRHWERGFWSFDLRRRDLVFTSIL